MAETSSWPFTYNDAVEDVRFTLTKFQLKNAVLLAQAPGCPVDP